MQILINSNVRQAIKILNKYGTKTIIVINNNKKLVGTLSDGDIRKSIIKGYNLKSSINNIYNKKPIFLFENQIDPKSCTIFEQSGVKNSLTKIKSWFSKNGSEISEKKKIGIIELSDIENIDEFLLNLSK